MKLVDMPDLGSGAVRCEGSSPFARTKNPQQQMLLGIFILRGLALNLFQLFSHLQKSILLVLLLK